MTRRDVVIRRCEDGLTEDMFPLCARGRSRYPLKQIIDLFSEPLQFGERDIDVHSVSERRERVRVWRGDEDREMVRFEGDESRPGER